MQFCVIRLDHLGDLILTTPLLRAVSRAGYQVDVVCSAYAKPLLDAHPCLRQSFAMEEIAPGFPKAWPTLARWLRSRRYDAVLLPYAQPHQLLLASAFSGAPRRVAMWGGVWGRLTMHTCIRSRILENPRHFCDVCLDCARVLGIEPAGLKPELHLATAERSEMRARLSAKFGSRRTVVVHPGSGGNACNLPEGEYAALAGLIMNLTDCALVVTGSMAERKGYEGWPIAPQGSERFWLAAGELSLRELMALIAETDLLVCASTGPLHIASAFGKKTLSPFCPSVPLGARLWGNIGGEALVLEQPRELCPKCLDPKKGPCDFNGAITARQLFERLGV